jgi:hypothetical protein
VYIIRDPELKLAQIEEVQKEVSRLLAGGGETAGPAGEAKSTEEAAPAGNPATEEPREPEAEMPAEAEQEAASEEVVAMEAVAPAGGE